MVPQEPPVQPELPGQQAQVVQTEPLALTEQPAELVRLAPPVPQVPAALTALQEQWAQPEALAQRALPAYSPTEPIPEILPFGMAPNGGLTTTIFIMTEQMWE